MANTVNPPLGCAVGLYTRVSKFTPQNTAVLNCPTQSSVVSECTISTLSHRSLSSFKDCKWKMYIELDGDDVAVTYIKDIVFNANRQDVEVLRMTKVLLESFFFPKSFSYGPSDLLLQRKVRMYDLIQLNEKNQSETLNFHSQLFKSQFDCFAASICDGQMDHWNSAEPASGLYSQL